jgi:hypothetical protein
MEEDFFVDDVSGDDSETGESTDGDYGEYQSSDGEEVYEVNEGENNLQLEPNNFSIPLNLAR